MKNSEIIVSTQVNYKDSCVIRYIINKYLGNQYSISRLAIYDVSKKIKALSVLSIEKRNELEDIIDKYLEE